MEPSHQHDISGRAHLETRRSAGQVPLELTLFDLPPHQDPDPVSDNFILCLALRGTVRADFQFGDGWRHAIVGPGSFMPITPPHTLGELMIDAPHRHLMLALPMHAVAEFAHGAANFGPLHGAAFRDPLAARLCLTLWEEAKAANPSGPLFADCARAALVAALWRRARNSPEQSLQPTSQGPGFSPKIWALLQAEIENRLDETLTIATLAELAGLRESRFLQAFRQQTGFSPYRYVLNKRIEKASALLSGTKLGLAEIALASGFADQAHMTATFTRHLGRTPGAIRRAVH